MTSIAISKSKNTIDTFFVRMGDVLSALLVYVGTAWLSFHTQHFALFNIAMIIVWLFLAFYIGKENRRLISESEQNIGSE